MLFDRLKGFQESGESIVLLPVFDAFTNDLVSEYTYGFNPVIQQTPFSIR